MKRISICYLVLVFLVALTSAYMVHEEPEEETIETFRGKRQQDDVMVIDRVFNISVTSIKQSMSSDKNLSPPKIELKDDVSKIPVITIKAVRKLNKSRQQTKFDEIESPSNKTVNLETNKESVNNTDQLYLMEIKKRVEAQRQQQRLYEEQLHRRRLELVLEHNKRMQNQIIEQNKSPYSHIYRDPFGFNALTKLVVGPHGVFNGHTGNGDGHVYQFFNKEKPLHFRRLRKQDKQLQHQDKHEDQNLSHLIHTKPTLSLSSTTTIASNNIIMSSTASSTHNYEVHEVVDEGINPFSWPNWFGIINNHSKTTQIYSSDQIQSKIDSKKVKVKFDVLPLQNKITMKDEDHYKNKYAQARKNYNVLETELTGNEIDGDLESNENRLTLIKKGEKVLFPNN